MSVPEQLYHKFRALSGQTITLSAMRMEVLAEMARRGFTPADVELVWRWVKQQIARAEGGYNVASLQFGVLLGRDLRDVDRFEDKLEIARQSKLGRESSKAGMKEVACAPARPSITDSEAARLREQRKKEVEEFHRRMGR